MNNSKSIKLKIELSNDVYNVVEETLLYMDNKNNYKENDFTKLILAIYKEKYEYVTNDNGYRDQVELLSDYFKKEYNYSLITFILIKNLLDIDYSQILLKHIEDKNILEQIIYFLETENYIELLDLIENDKKTFIALAKI